MKKFSFYRKPVITRIPLDPEQAVLAQCVVAGGAWFVDSPGGLYCFAGPGTGPSCVTAVRGAKTAVSRRSPEDAVPS